MSDCCAMHNAASDLCKMSKFHHKSCKCPFLCIGDSIAFWFAVPQKPQQFSRAKIENAKWTFCQPLFKLFAISLQQNLLFSVNELTTVDSKKFQSQLANGIQCKMIDNAVQSVEAIAQFHYCIKVFAQLIASKTSYHAEHQLRKFKDILALSVSLTKSKPKCVHILYAILQNWVLMFMLQRGSFVEVSLFGAKNTFINVLICDFQLRMQLNCHPCVHASLNLTFSPVVISNAFFWLWVVAWVIIPSKFLLLHFMVVS